MTREKLRRRGFSDSDIDWIMDEWTKSLSRESVRLSALTLKDIVEDLAPAQRSEINTSVHVSLAALTIDIAAKRARCARRTISRAIGSGEILAVKGTTGLVYLDRESFDKWMAARTPTLPTMSHLSGA